MNDVRQQKLQRILDRVAELGADSDCTHSAWSDGLCCSMTNDENCRNINDWCLHCLSTKLTNCRIAGPSSAEPTGDQRCSPSLDYANERIDSLHKRMGTMEGSMCAILSGIIRLVEKLT